MNTPENAWSLLASDELLLKILSNNYSICLYSGVLLDMFALITVLKFTAKAVRKWLNDLGVNTLFIEPGSPWENGYIESFNGKLRDELLDREVFTTLTEARVLTEEWRKEYNQVRPHSALNYRPPTPEAIMSVTLTQKVV